MRKLMIIAGLALGALSVGAIGGSGTVSAAGNQAADANVSFHPLPAGEDGDDGDDEMWRGGGGGSGSGAGSGSLPATGIDATSLALVGALTLAAGGATHRVAMRRQSGR